MDNERVEIRKVYRGYIVVTTEVNTRQQEKIEEYVFADIKELIEWQKKYFGES